MLTLVVYAYHCTLVNLVDRPWSAWGAKSFLANLPWHLLGSGYIVCVGDHTLVIYNGAVIDIPSVR